MLLLGRLPSKIFDLTRASDALAPSSYMPDTRSAPECASKPERRATDLADLILSLSERQSFGLSEEVAQQDAVVLRVGDGVVGGGRGDEVGRDQLRSLVHELVERVLAVGPGRAPDDGL